MGTLLLNTTHYVMITYSLFIHLILEDGLPGDSKAIGRDSKAIGKIGVL